jgi:hypothetical protein
MSDQISQELIKLLGWFGLLAAALIGAIAWLIKIIVTHSLAKDIARLTSESTRKIEEMKIQATKEIEQLKIQLSRESEQLKIQLNAKSTEEMEQLKSSLSRIIKEHEIKFSGLHRERVDVIKNLRSKIISGYYASMRFSNKISLVLDSKLPFVEVKEGKFSDDELVERLKESFNEAWSKTGEALEYALDNRIFFRSVLYKQIDDFIGVLKHECWIYIYSAD